LKTHREAFCGAYLRLYSIQTIMIHFVRLRWPLTQRCGVVKILWRGAPWYLHAVG